MLKSFLKNSSVWISISNSMAYQKIRNPKFYKKQIEEEDFFRKLLKGHKNNLIFDVGANVGHKSFIFSKIAKRVLAFEPSQKCLHILNKRFKDSNVKVINVALGSEEGLLDFYEINNHETYNSLSKKHIETTVKERNIAGADSIKSKTVKTDTVEHYIAEYGLPSYLKIDVEGFEVEVIKGLKSIVPIISFEANLPEFLEEAIEIINYLSKISAEKYVFNFVTETAFLSDTFISKDQAIDFLRTTPLRYLEIYAIIKSES